MTNVAITECHKKQMEEGADGRKQTGNEIPVTFSHAVRVEEALAVGRAGEGEGLPAHRPRQHRQRQQVVRK